MAEVFLPDALARKYPNAANEWAWQYIFPSGSYSVDPRSGRERRHHIDEKLLQRAMKKAVGLSGITKLATPHTLRHSFATSAGERLRHPHRARAARPLRRFHHDDLHPCSQQRWQGRGESVG
jgi:integrase